MFEPFVILWRAQTRTHPHVARTCFARVRVHHPNALIVVFRDGEVDLSFVDERCCMVRELCLDDISAWKYFASQERFGAGLLLRDNIFVGARPFPPFLQNQFFWLEDPDRPDVSFRLEPANDIITFPKPLGLLGYFRKSFVEGLPMNTTGFGYVATQKGTGFTFGYEPCSVKSKDHVDALVQVDVCVYCMIE
jgi:hypothetical protein